MGAWPDRCGVAPLSESETEVDGDANPVRGYGAPVATHCRAFTKRMMFRTEGGDDMVTLFLCVRLPRTFGVKEGDRVTTVIRRGEEMLDAPARVRAVRKLRLSNLALCEWRGGPEGSG